MKKLHLLPNAITAFGLSCGLLAIFKSSSMQAITFGDKTLNLAILLLLLAGIADVLDGAIARLVSAESSFGIQFDSLSDAVTFGVAPVIIVLKTFSLKPGDEMAFIVLAGMMMYSLCGILRLVRHNTKEGAEKLCVSRNFVGLPIPAAAFAAVSANLFMMTDGFQRICHIDQDMRIIIMTIIMTALGYFMVSRWRFLSLKNLHFKLPTFMLVFSMVAFATLLLYGILKHFAITFILTAWGYLIVAWILSIVRLMAGKQSKTLEDFEPESEEENVL